MASSNKVFGYIRVSTQKQGREGVSLEAQRDAISRYATSRGLEIVEWIEDQESAAKQGRTGFTRMVSLLRRGKASGFICHKLDRSVRNIYDWSELNRLVDQGVQIHFSHESLDLDSLSGKLSADIQAAIAAHYSRNLRDEVRKGMIGRLKQGYLPFTAPRGYLDCGAGKPKEIDPVVGPLIRQLFELYATGNYGFRELRAEMASRGLVTSNGKALALDSFTVILNNTFYYGLITIQRTGETYVGNHAPLISKALFERCQDVLHKRIRHRAMRFDHVFRRYIQCKGCGRHLIGETQKGRVYYRCHSMSCKGVSIREEVIVEKLRAAMTDLAPITWCIEDLQKRLLKKQSEQTTWRAARSQQITLQIKSTESKLSTLVDLLLEGTLDQAVYLEKKRLLNIRLTELRQELEAIATGDVPQPDGARLVVELDSTLKSLGKTASARETKMYADQFVSNFEVLGKQPCFSYVLPIQGLVNALKLGPGAPAPDPRRTLEVLLKALGLQ